MKTAAQASQKFVERASVASGDYVEGALATSKDQAALAIAAKGNYATAVQAAIQRDAFAKGLQRSGKEKWRRGIQEKGGSRFASGVAASAGDYATNSGRYDAARGAASSLPRGAKGDPKNLARVTAVVNALRAVKVA